jgi:MFS family permease
MSETVASGEGPGSGEAAKPSGRFLWYASLTGTERRTFWACFAGWGLDGMDVFLYTYMIPTLTALWGISHLQAGAVVTVSLLTSSLGGWIAGALADRYGRVRVLQGAVLWYSAFSLLSAAAQTYPQLLVLRALHGLGFGGEWAVGATLMGEIIRSKYRASATGTVHSAWALGSAAAALAYGAAFSILPTEVAWRALFAFGALPALLVIYMRYGVQESDVFLASRAAARAAPRGTTFLEIFALSRLRNTVLGAVLAMGMLGGGYALQTWLPTYLSTTRNLSVLHTSGYVLVFEVGHFLGYVIGAYLADAIGRRKCFTLFACGTASFALLTLGLPLSNALLLVLIFPFGFCQAGVYGGIAATLNELFPTRMRASGVGFCYNFGRALGAVFPLVIGLLTAISSLATTIAVVTTSSYAFVVLAATLLPETRGTRLVSDAPDA